ncbi:MAG: hypothetical protein GF355_14105 [Candidatus Eisenbacteria bacterium]|nr:hypothetical protein [Candidatus Eisenbacteria bacterium]
MRRLTGALLTAFFVAYPMGALAGGEAAQSLGYHDGTVVVPGAMEEICPGATLQQRDDGSFENGYWWCYGGIMEPDYGSWAQCFSDDFVCGIQFILTQVGTYEGQTMDVYVWDRSSDGTPPDPKPGNVLWVLHDLDPGPPAFWPEVSEHNVQVCCIPGGDHFIGFWPNSPGDCTGWYIAADENGPGGSAARTKVAPGIGLPTGWHAPNSLGAPFDDCQALGMREFTGYGDCEAASVPEEGEIVPQTWGAIKQLY